jgi:hypothetical protein
MHCRHLGFYTEAHCPWKRGFGNGPHGGGGSDYGYLGGTASVAPLSQLELRIIDAPCLLDASHGASISPLTESGL